MTKPISVPRHRIPRLNALCPKCQDGYGSIIMATPYSEGYHRRHKCSNDACGHAFYTITPYDGGQARYSLVPFRDRPLTELEEMQRLNWWSEIEPGVVTTESNRHEFLQRVAKALDMKEEMRSEVDTYLVAVVTALKQRVEQMDATQNKDEDNGRID